MTFPNTTLVAASIFLSVAALAPSAAATDRKVPTTVYPTIQSAIDASESGDRILVARAKEGPYAENVLVNVSGIQILGKRAEVNAGGSGSGFSIVASDVLISGFIVRNAGDGGVVGVGNGIEINRVEVEGCNGNGIHISGDDSTVERCRVKYVGGNGIVVEAASNSGTIRVERNLVCLNADSGIVSSGADVIIERNVVEYNQDDGLQVNDGGYGASNGTAVTSNRIRSNGGNGMCVFGTSDGGIDISANSIEQNGRSGLNIETGSEASADKNKIQGNSEHGVTVSGTGSNFTDNRVENNALNGISLNNGLGVGGHELDGNTVRGNGRDGIVVQGSENMIHDNTSERNLGDGIDIVASAPGDSLGNTVQGNRCNRNGHEGIDNSGTNTVIDANKCAKNGPAGDGIDIAGSGNKADPGDEIGIGTTSSYANNKTGDQSDEDSTIPQVIDL